MESAERRRKLCCKRDVFSVCGLQGSRRKDFEDSCVYEIELQITNYKLQITNYRLQISFMNLRSNEK